MIGNDLISLKDILESKRIIIWGAGNTAKNFCERYREQVPCYALTSNDKDIVSINGIKTIRPCEINPQTDFIIVCSIYYDEIRYQILCLWGERSDIYFMRWDIFEKLYESEMQGKKLIVAVGQCEILHICNALDLIKSIRDKYSIIYFDEQKVCAHGNKCNLAETRECLKLLWKADYFIKPSVLSPQPMKNFKFLQEHTSSRCKTITVALFNGDSYFPQDIAKEREEFNKYYVVKRNAKLRAFVEKDQIIEKYIDEGYSVREIMDRILRDDVFDYDEVINNHNNCIKRARIADKVSDIKMADFMYEKYNVMKLYCDRGHFSENLLKEYVIRLLQFLDENIDEVQFMEFSKLFENVNEFPIYPCTAKILELEFINRDTLYREYRYDGIRLVTFEEYMEAFIRYCKSGKETLKYSYWKHC